MLGGVVDSEGALDGKRTELSDCLLYFKGGRSRKDMTHITELEELHGLYFVIFIEESPGQLLYITRRTQ